MKSAAKWVVGLYLLLLSLSAFGQECLRWDNNAASTAGPYVVALPNSTITWCTTGAAGIPCTPTTPTYTDSTCTTQCPAGQFVQNGSTTCTTKADQQGNFGAWVHCGQLYYTVSGTGVKPYGPKVVTLPCGSSQFAQSFTFNQTVPATTWVIPHNFNDQNLIIQAYDTNKHLIFPDTTVMTSLNTATLTFTSAQAGLAVVMHSANPVFAPGLSSVVVTNPTVNQHVVGNSFLLTVDGGIVSSTSLSAPILSISGNATISGSTTSGSFIGPLTGNVTGNLVGNVTSGGTSTFNNVSLTGTLAGGIISGSTINGGSINNTPIGATTASTGKFSQITLQGAVGNRPVGTDASGHLVENSGISVVQALYGGATCTAGPGNSVGAECTSTYSWPSAFADTNYSPVCTGVGPSSSSGAISACTVTVSSFSTTGITVIIGDQRSSDTCSFAHVSCVGAHQ